ncbi:ABC transporter permease subunit [Clostridium sp. BJN0001]|uniref:ABC transporter permease n=1 Tax=Clostridium sp. BJN0001 TaxID=2930219 RepID=UPI001FD3EC91|nr:ABC transporter permease subunit [Clostridium sp. BJN0001]
MKSKINKLFDKKYVSIILWVAILIILWEIGAIIVSVTKRSPENILPHLYKIIMSIFSSKKVSGGMSASMVVFVSAQATVIRAMIGFILGAFAGFILALLMKLSGICEKILFPYLMLIQLIPVLGLAPIVLAITGDINKSRIIIAALLSFYPVATNTLAGFKSVGKDKYELMKTYAAKKGTVYLKVLIPSAIPYFFTGAKIAAPMALTASFLVDTLQGDGGLGCMLSQSLKHAMSIYVFWIIVFLSAFLGIFSGVLMSWIENLVSPEKRALRKAKKIRGGN